HIREATDLAVKLRVSEHPLLARLAIARRLALPNEGRAVRHRRAEPFVQAVGADVELPAQEPLRKRLPPLENLLERLCPDQFLLRHAPPELLRSLDGLVVKLAILRHRLDVRADGERLGRLEDAVLVEDRRDV